MIRTILVFLLLANTLFAQEANSTLLFGDQITTSATPTWGERFGEVAERSYSELEQRISVLEQLIPPYIPTWTWPDHDKPNAFDRLRQHMAGENVHPARSVAKWSRAELAFIHDCDHIEEYQKEGRALPVLKDQRLRDWLRAKSPAKALPRKLGWAVKRIVMHTQPNCPPCAQWKRDNLAAVEADGVEFIEAQPDGRPTPSFTVEYCSDDQCRTLRFGNVRYQTIKNSL